MVLGSGDHRYERVEGWGRIPEYFRITGLGPIATGGVVDVACDSGDRVYAFCRGNHPVLVFEPDGSFVSCWGEGHFRWPHGIHIDSEDNVYLIDAQTHTIDKFTVGGELLTTLGTRNWASTTMRGEPFNMPTSVTVAPDGSLFVCDGYGNQRVHKFSPGGELLTSWGGWGSGPGQFILPHFADVDGQGTVYVCDRENSRVQVFSSDGEYITEWSQQNRPSDVHIDRGSGIVYLGEAGGPTMAPRISIRDLKGNILSSWEGRKADGTGVLGGPHGIGVDSRGNIYEAAIGGDPGIQKFARIA